MGTLQALRTREVETTAPEFSVRQAREIIEDLFVPRPWIYWTDCFLSTAIGYFLAATYLEMSGLSWQRLACFLVGGFALFRAGTFIHEIVHMRRGSMLGFRAAWNIFCGIPMLMPSFTYGNHVDHHRKDHYGTHHDGEYLPLGTGPASRIAFYFMQALILPVEVFCRFLLLTPISFCHPRLRKWVLERASSYGINPHYRRKIPDGAPRAIWAALELACFVRVAGMAGVVVLGLYPWTRLLDLYLLAVLVLGLNYIRNLVAHHYRNSGEEMTYVGQLEDSVTLTGVPLLTELFFPLGLRYHALHHLFPTLPYHALGAAHRRLISRLPAGSSYHRTVVPGYWAAVRELWNDATGRTRTR